MKFASHLSRLLFVLPLSCCLLNAQPQAASQAVTVMVPRLVSFTGRAIDEHGSCRHYVLNLQRSVRRVCSVA